MLHGEKDYSCSISIPQSSLAALRSCVTDRGNELRGCVGACFGEPAHLRGGRAARTRSSLVPSGLLP